MLAMRRHIEDNFKNAELEFSPFPHLVIENFFPDEVYDQILKHNLFKFNQGHEWQSKSTSSFVSGKTPYHARKQINFLADQPIEGPTDAVAFWQEIRDCFMTDRWFDRLVVQKYMAYFQLRFGDLVTDPDFFDFFKRELFLQRHETGYYIGPHTDIPSRVFTCIFSFAERSGFEDYGTELLRHVDRLVRCTGRDHYAPDAFEVVKVAPYKPNNFLLFFKTTQSFHSVKAITDAVPNQRYGMQYQFYERKNGVFQDLSAPEKMVGGTKVPSLLARAITKAKSLVSA